MRAIPFALALAAALALGRPAWSEAQRAPVVLDNCGVALAFERAPERVVTVGQSTTELLYALGLGERVVGTSVWFTAVREDFAEQDAQVPRLADNAPSFESVLAPRPELVTAQFEAHVGVQGGVATREQFHELGVQTYVLPADCIGKDNRAADGVRTSDFSVETVYQAIEELARIFAVEARGAALAEELRGRQAQAMARAAALGLEGATAVFWFSSPDGGVDPFVAGRRGIPAFIMKALGLRNVIETDEEWPTVGWETIARADPDVIMIARMERRRFAADDYEAKLRFLQTDPVASRMSAVRQGRIVVVDAHAAHASLRLFDGMETIVDALETADPVR